MAISVASPTDLAVVARGVRRAFDGREVLAGVDLQIRAGEFVGLLGRSGSGKTTFLRALAGFDEEALGELLVPARRAVVFQDPRLLPWQRVLTNVIVGLPRGQQSRERGRAALSEVGLAGREEAWPRVLSGGEAQRANLARALVREPQLMLLDEPFGALDALTRMRMHGLLRRLYIEHGPAILLVTHDVEEAIVLCDRILVLTEGRISLDRYVDRAERERGSAGYAALRAELLNELGVPSD